MSRQTRQRESVRAALERGESFRSAQDLYAELRASRVPIGLTTVYRALADLAADGVVDVLRTDGGEAIYRRCSRSHHHHLVCRHCGKTVEVEGPAVERWAARVAAAAGFTDVTHTVEVVGICAGCARA